MIKTTPMRFSVVPSGEFEAQNFGKTLVNYTNIVYYCISNIG